MKTIVECLPVIGAKRTDIENWTGRLKLGTDYEATVPGRARLYSKANVLELALICAFVKAGFTAQLAPAMAAPLVKKHIAGKTLKEWAAVSPGNYSVGRLADRLDQISFDKMAQARPENPLIFCVVHVGEIVRRVEKLFAQEKVEA